MNHWIRFSCDNTNEEERVMNLMFLVFVLALIYKFFDGFKKGVVKQVISLVSMLILCALAALIAGGISNYNSGKIVNVLVCVVLLILLSIVHHILGIVFFSAKVVSKLPVVSLANKLCGAVFGVVEVIVILWLLYSLIGVFNLGAIGQFIISSTEGNPVLLWFYRHNYLAYVIVEYVLSKPLLNNI